MLLLQVPRIYPRALTAPMLKTLDGVALLLFAFRHDKIITSPFNSLEGFEWISARGSTAFVHRQSAIWQDQRFVSVLAMKVRN